MAIPLTLVACACGNRCDKSIDRLANPWSFIAVRTFSHYNLCVSTVQPLQWWKWEGGDAVLSVPTGRLIGNNDYERIAVIRADDRIMTASCVNLASALHIAERALCVDLTSLIPPEFGGEPQVIIPHAVTK